MINRDMDRVIVRNPDIALMLVCGNDSGFVRKLGFDESADSFVTDMLASYFQANLAAAFNRTEYANLAVSASGLAPRFVRFVHEVYLAAYVCLVAFNKA